MNSFKPNNYLPFSSQDNYLFNSTNNHCMPALCQDLHRALNKTSRVKQPLPSRHFQSCQTYEQDANISQREESVACLVLFTLYILHNQNKTKQRGKEDQSFPKNVKGAFYCLNPKTLQMTLTLNQLFFFQTSSHNSLWVKKQFRVSASMLIF